MGTDHVEASSRSVTEPPQHEFNNAHARHHLGTSSAYVHAYACHCRRCACTPLPPMRVCATAAGAHACHCRRCACGALAPIAVPTRAITTGTPTTLATRPAACAPYLYLPQPESSAASVPLNFMSPRLACSPALECTARGLEQSTGLPAVARAHAWGLPHITARATAGRPQTPVCPNGVAQQLVTINIDVLIKLVPRYHNYQHLLALYTLLLPTVDLRGMAAVFTWRRAESVFEENTTALVP